MSKILDWVGSHPKTTAGVIALVALLLLVIVRVRQSRKMDKLAWKAIAAANAAIASTQGIPEVCPARGTDRNVGVWDLRAEQFLFGHGGNASSFEYVMLLVETGISDGHDTASLHVVKLPELELVATTRIVGPEHGGGVQIVTSTPFTKPTTKTLGRSAHEEYEDYVEASVKTCLEQMRRDPAEVARQQAAKEAWAADKADMSRRQNARVMGRRYDDCMREREEGNRVCREMCEKAQRSDVCLARCDKDDERARQGCEAKRGPHAPE